MRDIEVYALRSSTAGFTRLGDVSAQISGTVLPMGALKKAGQPCEGYRGRWRPRGRRQTTRNISGVRWARWM